MMFNSLREDLSWKLGRALDVSEVEMLMIWAGLTPAQKTDALDRIAETLPHLLPHRVKQKAA